MKKLAAFVASAVVVLFSQAAFAQNLTLSVQNDTVWFGPKALSYDAVGALMEEKAPQTVFVYVDYKTLKRTIKDSGYWYRDVIASNGENL